MRKCATDGVLVIALLLCLPSALAASCVPVGGEPNDNATVTAKKIEYASAVISNPEYLANDKHCVAAAMQFLGLINASEAIPKLIDLLGYRARGSTYDSLDFKQFPAISALSMMGAPAAPALIRVIADKDNSSVESKNAISALMSMRIYRKSPAEPIALLRGAADKESDPIAAERLRAAAKDAKDHWRR